RATSEGVRTPSSAATPPARFFGPCMQQESSWTTPSAFGRPPQPSLVSSGSNSTILTPAISASSTSSPLTIFAKAISTPVLSPPFLNLLPLAEAITMGRLLPGVIMLGAWPNARGAAAAARPTAVPVLTNSRRFTLGDMDTPSNAVQRVNGVIADDPVPVAVSAIKNHQFLSA